VELFRNVLSQAARPGAAVARSEAARPEESRT
jgi:hypothetical protein